MIPYAGSAGEPILVPRASGADLMRATRAQATKQVIEAMTAGGSTNFSLAFEVRRMLCFECRPSILAF
jgi:hypothetical protein